MYTDFVVNQGEGSIVGNGEVGEVLQGARFDTGILRPYRKDNGDPRLYITVNSGRMVLDKKTGGYKPKKVEMSVWKAMELGLPVTNATLGLRKLEWELLDKQVLLAARKRLRAWSDLAAAASYSVPGMSKTILEHETMSDPGLAVTDMDALTDARADTPKFQLEGLPLPITHSDFTFNQRQLMISKNSGQGLDLRMGEAAGRRVAESVERVLIGIDAGMTYGGGSSAPTYGRTSKVYGYTNFTNRNTYTSVTTPTGANPQSTVANVLAMRDLLLADNFFGPFMLYHSNDWDQYMDNDYAFTNGSNWATNPNMTLRDRLRKIDGISDVRRLDFWTPVNSSGTSLPFQLLLVQMNAEVARAVVGMDITTIQWDVKGGLQTNFKVMTIMVPQLRADNAGNCGICHGTTS